MIKFKKFIFYYLFLYFSFIPLCFSAFEINARTAILQDYLSGKILYEKDVKKSIYPASMTKIMTSIVVFDLLKSGDLNLDDKVMVSENAWRLSQSGYSSMFIMVGDEVTIEELLKGIIIASGNDACVALAEGVAGTEEEFAIMMNSKAAEIGMLNSNFTNASGINDPDNYSTVEDILLMSNYLIKNYPKYYTYFKETTFTWDRTGGDPITQGNRNPLLYKNFGADGIKTGYLAVEKYSLASSVKKGERRLIAVGSGFETKNSRSRQSKKLLTWGLTNFDTIKIAEINKEISRLQVWLGNKNEVQVYVKEDIYKTIPKARKKYLKAYIQYNGPILAPIKKNQKVGVLKVLYKDEIINKYEVYAFEEVKKLNVISRVIKSINYLIWGDV